MSGAEHRAAGAAESVDADSCMHACTLGDAAGVGIPSDHVFASVVPTPSRPAAPDCAGARIAPGAAPRGDRRARIVVPFARSPGISSSPPTSSTRSRIPIRPKPLASRRRGRSRGRRRATRDVDRAVALARSSICDAGRAGVLDDVGERLLHEPVDRGLELRRVAGRLRPRRRPGRPRADVDALRGGRALGERLDRRRRPELVERGRAQLGDQRAQAARSRSPICSTRGLAPPAQPVGSSPRRARRRAALAGRRAPAASRRAARAPSGGARCSDASMLSRSRSSLRRPARSRRRSRRWPRRPPAAARPRRRTRARRRGGRMRRARRARGRGRPAARSGRSARRTPRASEKRSRVRDVGEPLGALPVRSDLARRPSPRSGTRVPTQPAVDARRRRGRDDQLVALARAGSPARARSTSARPRLTISSSTRSRSVSPPSARAIAVVASRPARPARARRGARSPA